MTDTVVWSAPVEGNALTITGSGLDLADTFGTPPLGHGPLGDPGGDPAIGAIMATTWDTVTDSNILMAAVPFGSTPGDGVDLADPPDESLVGGTWVLSFNTSVLDGEIFAYSARPDDFYNTGYTIGVGFGVVDGFGGSTVTTADYPFNLAAAGAVFNLAKYLDTGRMDIFGGLSMAPVTTENLAAVASGELCPTIRLTGPHNGFDPLWYVADMTLQIVVSDVAAPMVRSVCRQFPRDDSLGFGAATRIFPPSKGRRIAGGY